MHSQFVYQIADFATTREFDSLTPPLVRQRACRIVADTIAVIVSGNRGTDVTALAHKFAQQVDGATFLGTQRRMNPLVVALLNGAGGVSLELDEGNQFATNHPAIHALPAILAAAEDRAVSGSEFLSAFIAAYESSVRVGRATRLREEVHPFGTHAVIGASVGVGRIIALDLQQMATAIEVAGGLAIASSQTAANAGATVRNLFTGMTALAGFLSALAADSSYTGEPESLQNVFGKILGTSFAPDGSDLGKRWYIEENYFKLYAASRWTHAPIEAALELRQRCKWDQLESIRVETYDPATRLDSSKPTNWFGAKHSIPYSFAIAFVFGEAGNSVFTNAIAEDPRVRTVAEKVIVEEDPTFTSMSPAVRPARVTAQDRQGNSFESYIEFPRGDNHHPLTAAELDEKFLQLVIPSLGRSASQIALDLCLNLEQLPDIRELTSALTSDLGRDTETRPPKGKVAT